jgi:hypothetical protein
VPKYVKVVVISGVMGNVLAIEPKVHGFNPSQGQWIFKGNKNLQHAFLQRGSKAISPCHKILLHVKNPFEV